MKETSIPQLIKRLDAIFSTYIRLKNADENGICTCFTCGAKHHWKSIDNGHHCKRQYMSTRFNVMNCQPQCRKCNWLEQGADDKFKTNLIKKYGQNEYDKLIYLKFQTKKWTRFELEQMISAYRKEVKELECNKVII
jgi:hypothetical protein